MIQTKSTNQDALYQLRLSKVRNDVVCLRAFPPTRDRYIHIHTTRALLNVSQSYSGVSGLRIGPDAGSDPETCISYGIPYRSDGEDTGVGGELERVRLGQ